VGESCPCADPYECPKWDNFLSDLKSLPKGNWKRQRGLIILRRWKCPDGSKRLQCCSSWGKKESKSPTTTSTTKKPTTEVTTERTKTRITDDPSLGTWRPVGENGDCGGRTSPFFIVGGEDAELGELAFMALLGYDSTGSGRIYYTCGGSLINRYYVLTAAHCLDKKPVKEVVIDELTIAKDPDCAESNGLKSCVKKQSFKPESIHIHPKWVPRRPTDGNDIGLIRLDRPAVFYFDEGVDPKQLAMPACLPWKEGDTGREVEPGQVALVAGWGRTSNNRSEAKENYDQFSGSTDNLKKLEVPIVSTEECNEAFKGAIKPWSHICAGAEEGKDSCNGDSGGPLVMRASGEETPWHQIGVVSFGTSKCAKNKPGVYTRVVEFLGWMESVMRE